ncbi:MAG: GerA spore germination protein [Firmicutes bacterium]|nr:GerA spore germination protein [Bacillota bacterium]
MNKLPRFKFFKLSAVQPNSSLSETRQKLAEFQKQVQQSKAIESAINNVVKDLHKVPAQDEQPFIFTNNIEINEQLVRSALSRCDDITYRQFRAGKAKALLVYLSGLTDTNKLETTVIESLTGRLNSNETLGNINEITNLLITAANVTVVPKPKEAIANILKGNPLLLIDGISDAVSIDAAKYEKRQISKAENEDAAKGPHDSFNETLSDNIALVRRRTKDPDLKVEIFEIGVRTQTSVALLYVEDIVKPALADKIRSQLLSIRIDKVILSANIEEFLIDQIWNPFPQVLVTERPDKIVAGLYEGRVSIIVDNSPTAMLLPITLQDLMQSVDDYTGRPAVASLIRFTRYIAAFIAVFLPAIYVSIVSYHPGILPSGLSFYIAELRARTPFPSLLEAFLMEGLLEIFQEAIVRLPQKLSAAAGVVGALVIGTTVVEAGLANALLVVVIALTGLSAFSMPSYPFGMALRFFRIPALLAASILGLYGISVFFIVMIVFLCSLRTYDESYLGDLFDITLIEDWKDGLLRFPAKFLTLRPKRLGAKDRTKIGSEN